MSVDGLEADFQATALLQFGSVFMQKGIGMTLLKLLQDGEFSLLHESWSTRCSPWGEVLAISPEDALYRRAGDAKEVGKFLLGDPALVVMVEVMDPLADLQGNRHAGPR